VKATKGTHQEASPIPRNQEEKLNPKPDLSIKLRETEHAENGSLNSSRSLTNIEH